MYSQGVTTMSEEFTVLSEEEAFQLLKKPISKTVPIDKLPRVNIELLGKNSIKIQRKCWPYRHKIYEALGFNCLHLDQLSIRGQALRHLARGVRMVKIQINKQSELASIKPRAKELRKVFLLSAEAIYIVYPDKKRAKKYLAIIDKIRKGRITNRGIGTDLLDLVMMIKKNLELFEEKSPITVDMLAEGEFIGNIFESHHFVLKKEKVMVDLEDRLLMLRKSVTYYKESYEEVRRACLFSLYYECGEKFIPRFLATGRAPRKARKTKDNKSQSESEQS